MEMEKAQHYLKNIPSDVIKLVCSLLGLAYFIYLIQSDAQKAYKKRAYWIPGNAFILSALTIQVLSYLDTSTVNISDKPNYSEMALLLGNHLLIESQRLIICVFMGYLLPGMARPGSGGQWGDISALAITLFTDITSELYFLHKSKDLFRLLTDRKIVQKTDYDYKFDMAVEFKQQPSIRIWFMVSSVGILVSVIFLILFLVCAIVAGNTIRGVLSQRISAALSTEKIENSSKSVEDEVFKSWIVARACRPEYVIARSVLISGAGMVVTLRIILSILKFNFVQYKSVVLLNDGLDELRKARLVFQYAFVLVGWTAVCWRWITAVLYFPRLKHTRRFFVVEDFWTRAISQKRFGWESSNALQRENILKEKLANRIRLHVYLCLLRSVQIFVTGFLMALQSLVVLLAKFCWVLSEIAIGNNFVRLSVLGPRDLDFYLNYEAAKHDYDEFGKYRHVLKRVCMPQENPGSLWLANRESIQQTEKRMEAGYKDAKKCRELIDLISHYPSACTESLVNKFESLPLVKAYFPNLGKMCWKMTAVSYLHIITEIFPGSDLLDRSIKVYEQAEDFMNFLDSAEIEQDSEMEFLDRLGMEADQMSKAADMEFNRLKKYVSTEREILPVEEIRKLMDSAEKVLADNKFLYEDVDADGVELQDSKDLLKIAPSYSLFRVCKHLLPNTDDDMMDVGNLSNKIEDNLRNLFAHCVSQVTDKLVNNCRNWASEFEEDKIWEAVSLAGKVKLVLENSEVGAQA
ncbi:hypothetical protein SUGI_0233870 [Cryptomeria japonica]|nr:hypothetical protein SUGI_0233870 [Cryptomeria japonica]